jgi:hypothetical protein
MSSKKNAKKQVKAVVDTQPHPKRKRIVSLAQYEAEAKADVGKNTTAPATATTADVPPGSQTSRKAGQSAKAKRTSGLTAAAEVLREAGTPMNCGDIVKAMLEKGYWQTKGLTPASTIYAAIITEIAKKGDKSRFRKTDRGMFTLAN